jgi:diguanylate cyclase (GGDEF)-like protein
MAGKITLDAVARLTSQRYRHDLVVNLVRVTARLMGTQSVSYYEVTPGPGAGEDPLFRNYLVPEASLSWPEQKLLLRAYRRRRVVRARGAKGARIAVAHPVQGAEGVQGLLLVRVRLYRPADHRELGKLLAVYRNFQQLFDRVDRDALTGLYNRQAFGETINRIMHPVQGARSRRKDRERVYWLGILDIDHFKNVNDRHGHLIGDEVLLLFARLMRDAFRYEDRLFRYGGEEFIVILEGANGDSAQQIFERFRLAVAATRFPQEIHITVSIGFTEVLHEGLPSDVIDRADRALYMAKNSGRNQVLSYEGLLAQGRLRHAEYPSHQDVQLWLNASDKS